MNRLIGESKRGEKISLRILKQVDPEVLLKLGLVGEMQDIRSEDEGSSSGEMNFKIKESKASIPEIKLCPSYDEAFE